MEDKVFKRGNNYLELMFDVSKTVGLYKCLVCGSNKEINKSQVLTGHDKTCGCRNGGRSQIKITVGKDGKIRTQTGMILNSKIANGYEAVSVNGKTHYVHRLVAETFLPNPLNLSDVNHINGIKTDNRVENLEWCSRGDNLNHAINKGLKVVKKGFKSPKRKFTMEQIRYIKESNIGSTTLGRMLGVSKTTILNIRNGKIYKD